MILIEYYMYEGEHYAISSRRISVYTIKCLYGRSRRRPAIRRSNPVLAPVFVRPKKIILIKREYSISMKQKLLEMIQVTVWLHSDEFIFVWFNKNEKGRQNRSSATKTELLRRAGATT